MTTSTKRPPVATLIDVTNRYDPRKPFPWNVLGAHVKRALDDMDIVIGPDGGLYRADTLEERRDVAAQEFTPGFHAGGQE